MCNMLGHEKVLLAYGQFSAVVIVIHIRTHRLAHSHTLIPGVQVYASECECAHQQVPFSDQTSLTSVYLQKTLLSVS